MVGRAFDGALQDAGVVETLAAVGRLHAARVEADASIFVLAAHFADLSAGDALPVTAARGARVAGERSVRLGGAGTPRVAEFACAEFGVRVQLGSWAARRFIADALDVRHRLPSIWTRVQDGRARVGYARAVAARTRHLSREAAADVDAAMAPFVDGCLPWGRFEARLEGVIVRADPQAAAVREAERVGMQFAKRTRVSEQGTAGFYVRSTAGVVARLDATVGFVAEALRAFGDLEDLDARRVKALVVLANPARAVELLAAFRALRARTLDVPLEPDGPADEADRDARFGLTPHPEPAPEPAADLDPLGRMDTFARRVRFEPMRLPAWLQPPPPAAVEAVDAAAPIPEPRDPAEPPRTRPRFAFDWSRLLPPLTLNLHLAAEDLATGQGGVARWEGVGPVTHQFVHEHLRPLHRYRIQPVIDLAGQAPADAYEIPERHRRAVRLRTPADCFPFSSALDTGPGDGIDVDHTLPYQHRDESDTSTPAGDNEPDEPNGGGGTGDSADASATRADGAGSAGERQLGSTMENYGPLGRFHHRIKTHGHWTVRQPFPGIYLWRDPHGHLTLVDHTGTHPVGPAGHDPQLTLLDHPHPIDLDLETG